MVWHDKITSKYDCFKDGVPAEVRGELVRWCLPLHIHGGLSHVADMVNELLMPRHEAMMKAAELGHVLWLERMLCSWSYLPGTADVALTAAVNGHAEAVKIVFACAIPDHDELVTAWIVLNASAACGHLDVVKFATGVVQSFVGSDNFKNLARRSDALSTAIHGGYLSVVEFLLVSNHFLWDFTKAFAQAVAEQQEVIAQVMYDIFLKVDNVSFDSDSLLAHLADNGYVEALRYLYDHQVSDAASIDEAFGAAVFAGNDDIAEFLHDTGNVSTEMIAEVLVEVVKQGFIDRVSWLCRKGIVSPQHLNEAFVNTSNGEILKVLLSTELISSEPIALVFKKIVDCGSLGQIKCLLNHVPSESVTKAFLNAVNRGHTPVVELLFAYQCASAVEINEAFKRTVEFGRYSIVAVLINSPQVSQCLKNEALIHAAGCGRCQGKTFIENSDQWWSNSVLEKALKAAKDSEVQGVIRTKLHAIQKQ